MRRTFVISDWFYRLGHTIRRNRLAVILYALICLLFLVIGIAVGIGVSDKCTFVLNNNAIIFKYLRGDIGIVAFFFLDLLLSCIYCMFSASMFFNKPLAFLSLAPCAYRSYVLGMNVSIIIVVYSVSAIPMLFVLFVPICLIEIFILCLLSFRCFAFVALNGGCSPSRADLREYYYCVLQFLGVMAILGIIKALTLCLFGSALIGIV